MAEHDDWTTADDARVRAALTSLRTDVESTPLPDVRFVKARGMARRRRRFLTVGAAAAVAAIVAGTVGYDVLRPDGNVVHLPAARTSTTTTTTPSPTTSSTLDEPGILPVAKEWETSLDLPAGSVRLEQAKTLEGGVECGDALGKPTLQQSLTQTNSPVTAAATYWQTSGDKDKAIALEQSVAKCQQGPSFTVKSEYVGNYSLYSYSAKEAGSGWFAVVSGGQGVALLQLVDPAFADVKSGGFTEGELGALAEVAQTRLDRYATGTTTATTPPANGGPKAVNEKMTVTGPDPVPSSNLFVAASQWSSQGLTGGAKTSDGPGALEGSTAIASCETDDQQAGIGGQVGVVSIRTGAGAASYIGRQRVQLDDATDAAVQKGYVSARVAEAKALYAKGCDGANYTVQATPGPTDGTFRLDTVFTDGSATLSEWVGITSQRTPGAVSTVVITAAANPDQGFAELDRLLALARQKSAPAASTSTVDPPAPKTVTCADIAFTPNSDDLASDIAATGVTCAVADPLVRSNYGNSGEGTWPVNGWTCTAKKVQPDAGMGIRGFTCTKGSAMVTWRK